MLDRGVIVSCWRIFHLLYFILDRSEDVPSADQSDEDQDALEEIENVEGDPDLVGVTPTVGVFNPD